jgi:hypothetical protein
MSKSKILIALSILFLIGSVAFDFSQKKSFANSLQNIKDERTQIAYVADLKALWGAKGMKSKLTRVINSIPSSKKKNFLVKRNKAEIKLVSLSDRELNRVLSKLANLPLEFRKLSVVKSGDNFDLECTCVW